MNNIDIVVSVIIPIYNRFNVLNATLNSLYIQNFTSFEIIIVDDKSEEYFSSSETSLFWKAKFSERGINYKVIRNIDNLGSGLSRQNGLLISMGNYVAFLDSDDYWTHDFIECCLKTHHQNPEICATYVTSYYVDGTLRNKTDINFNSISSTIIKEYRVWQTGSILWKKKYLAEWKNLSSNQDFLFEFETSLNNDKIMLTEGPNLFINKNTGFHTFDRVNKNKNILNVIIIFSFVSKNLVLTKHKFSRKIYFNILIKNRLNFYYRILLKENLSLDFIEYLDFIKLNYYIKRNNIILLSHRFKIFIPIFNLLLNIEKYFLSKTIRIIDRYILNI